MTFCRRRKYFMTDVDKIIAEIQNLKMERDVAYFFFRK